MVGRLTRDEAHGGRQLLQALHTLERLRKARTGEDVPPPGALDVTVNGEVPGLPGEATAGLPCRWLRSAVSAPPFVALRRSPPFLHRAESSFRPRVLF